jgi:hypothetical protein
VLGEWPVFGPLRQEPEEEAEDDESDFVAASTSGADPWTVAALPAVPLDDPAPSVRVRTRSEGRRARYSLDPIGEPARRRRLGRGSAPGGETIDVPAHPRERVLPSTVSVD